MRIAILGFAREGQSTLRFIQKQPEYRGAEIWILDRNKGAKVPRDVKTSLGKEYLENLRGFDIVFRSPGIPYNLPELKKARHAGVAFSSATKLFFDKASAMGGSAPGGKSYHLLPIIIGVTGTKGKSTTSTLVYTLLRAGGRKVFFGGNIGKSILDILPKIKKGSFVVLELSSFQLQDLQTSPQVAVVLDVFPDHQDSHLNLNEYYDAKANIARYQKTGDKIFFFSAKGGSASGGKHSPKSIWIAQKSRGRKIAVDEKKFNLFRAEDLKIRGWHSFRNAVMAASVAQSLGVPRKTIARVIKNFRGLEHRLEFAKKIGRIRFYNDSASTNPHTSAAAIGSFPDERKILIAGGQDKNLDYKPLAEALKSSGGRTNTKLVVLFGENKKKIKKMITRSGVPIVLVEKLGSAIKTAYRFARKLVIRNQLSVIVLFSPGAASFDQFKNYADRGQRFKKEVMKLRSAQSFRKQPRFAPAANRASLSAQKSP